MSAKNEVPPVEIIPFGPGGAELCMTCFEILQMMETYSAYLGTAVDTYLTILFGYIVAMYLAGPVRLLREVCRWSFYRSHAGTGERFKQTLCGFKQITNRLVVGDFFHGFKQGIHDVRHIAR